MESVVLYDIKEAPGLSFGTNLVYLRVRRMVQLHCLRSEILRVRSTTWRVCGLREVVYLQNVY
jgi:hypothetical protein